MYFCFFWMTLRFHRVGQIEIQAIGDFSVTRQVAPTGWGAKTAVADCLVLKARIPTLIKILITLAGAPKIVVYMIPRDINPTLIMAALRI